jgi:hypothetical protein
MASLRDISVVVVAKEDFEKIHELSQTLMIVRNPTKVNAIKTLSNHVLKEFKRYQLSWLQFAQFQEEMETGTIRPTILRRHSFW